MNFSCLLSRTSSALLSGVFCLAAAHAQVAPSDEQVHAAQLQQRAAERAQARAEIEQARREIEARRQGAEKACWQRFAVEDCLTEARKTAREADHPLRERELRINREEREEKASERLRSIEKKQREKQVPTPVNATPRDGSGTLSTEERQTQAQQRAQEQVRRAQSHEASVAARQEAQALERAKAVQAQQEKLEAARARRAIKADDIANRKGAPLPIPDGLPKP